MCIDDNRTLLGRTLGRIASECGVSVPSLNTTTVQKLVKYFDVPDDQLWRVPLLRELLDTRSKKCSIENLTTDQITFIIEDICTS